MKSVNTAISRNNATTAALPPVRAATDAPETAAVNTGPGLLDMPNELLDIIVDSVINPAALAGSCRSFRAVCTARSIQRISEISRATQVQIRQWRTWKITAAQTLSEAEALIYPDEHTLLFLRFVRPVLERAVAAEPARVDRIAAFFAANERELVYSLAHVLLPDTLARLALWFGGGVCKWITQQLLAGGKMRELSAGLAGALWCAHGEPFMPRALEREMQALARRVGREDKKATLSTSHVISDELKWVRIGAMLARSGKAVSRVFRYVCCLRSSAQIVSIGIEDVYCSAFFVDLHGVVVPAESLSAEEAVALGVRSVHISCERIPFSEFDGNLRAPDWLLKSIGVYAD